MQLATKILLTVFATLTPASSDDGIHDLCEVVHRTTGAPAICGPHLVGAPVYDDDVCCAGNNCFAVTGECPVGETRYHCDLGEADNMGAVDCYFEVPDYCLENECDPAPLGYTAQPEPGFICCSFGICTELVDGSGTCLEEDIYYCVSLASLPDGTVECVDWDE